MSQVQILSPRLLHVRLEFFWELVRIPVHRSPPGGVFESLNERKSRMKKSALLILAVFVATLTASGCAKKTASEQLKADMNKAAGQMKKDMNNL